MEKALEKLRMELGIPKDDSLNKIEFGYGSILSPGSEPHPPPTPSYSYLSKLVCEADTDTERDDTHAHIRDVLGPSSTSLRFQKPPRPVVTDSGSEVDIGDGVDSSCVSETELRTTLKEVGIDSETTIEIVDIVTNNKSRSKKGTLTNEPESSIKVKKVHKSRSLPQHRSSLEQGSSVSS